MWRVVIEKGVDSSIVLKPGHNDPCERRITDFGNISYDLLTAVVREKNIIPFLNW